MLESPDMRVNGRLTAFYPGVRYSHHFPDALQFWMAYVARDLLRLGVYFRAAALLRQIPGAARFQAATYDDHDPDAPDGDEDPWRWIHGGDRDTLFDVLAECLRRLGAEGVMKQIPERKCYDSATLCEEWIDYLDRQAKLKNGLLTVVAVCLDELLVLPGMAELDAAPSPTWWQQWWSRMGAAGP